MEEEWIRLFSPVIGLTANVIIQVVSFRFRITSSMLKSIILGFGVGFLTVFVCDFFPLRDSGSLWQAIGVSMTDLLAYMALGYCYFHFINLGETARRVRILREIYYARIGLSRKEILSRYNGKTVLEYRMNRLLGNGQIILDEGKYRIGNPSMLFITKIILLLKRIVIGKTSGFN